MAAASSSKPSIRVRSAITLSGEELRILRALSLRKEGLLDMWLSGRCATDYVVICTLGTKIVGWGMLKVENNIYRANCGFYVAKKMRRQGIGRRLFRAIKRIAVRLGLRLRRTAWDEASSRFFRRVKTPHPR